MSYEVSVSLEVGSKGGILYIGRCYTPRLYKEDALALNERKY